MVHPVLSTSQFTDGSLIFMEHTVPVSLLSAHEYSWCSQCQSAYSELVNIHGAACAQSVTDSSLILMVHPEPVSLQTAYYIHGAPSAVCLQTAH